MGRWFRGWVRSYSAVAALLTLSVLLTVSSGLHAQALVKNAISVDPGNTKQVGAQFGYRLSYNCSSTSGPCLSAQVVDLLPPEVQYISTVPASPTGDVAAINVTPNFGGSGRTRVQFVMITPLPAGNSGDLIINVRFPNGSTPNGTVAINTADGINLQTTPGTLTTPPVNVTAVATTQVTLTKTLQTSPANLDLPETYRLRISVPNVNGALNLTAIGPVVDTLPPGTVFNGATPAADCQPGCLGTTPATVTWTAPCSVPLAPGGNCDIAVNVVFPSATFPSGTNVTNAFVSDATPLGQPPTSFGPGTITHPVTTFVPNPGMNLGKSLTGGSPNPPTLNQTFSWQLTTSNSGNVPIDNLVLIDTVPPAMFLASVTTGSFNNASDFAVGEGVRVSYEKNTALGVFTLWGSSPNATTNTTLTVPPPGLGVGEYITRIRWELGQAQVGMTASSNPVLTGQIRNPDNAGNPVAFGNTVQNCVALSAVYSAGPTSVTRNACNTLTVSGPFTQLNPAKDNLSGGGPFNPGQSVSFRLRVRSDARSSDPIPLQDLVATDLLPVDLQFTGWTFDDQTTGLPAPQVFDQIPNFQGSGRTLLRWRWNAGSGNLGVNQQVWINITTTIRSGTRNGTLSNTFNLEHDNAGLGQRCTGGSTADVQDFDGDANTAETLCTASTTINIAPIAQLVSSKTVRATCDASFTNTSAGLLAGGSFDYQLRVQNVGTVTMQNFVIIDILPAIGDTGVRDTNPRGSQFTPQLVAPITPPPGTTLYYSNSSNPCRGEVGGPTTSCDAPNWTTVPPTPISAARSFKVEFGARQLNAFDALSFNYRMLAPANLATGITAFNSFAYQTDRQDGLGSLAAEPQKVGVNLGTCPGAALGDFVWVDTNRNGLQDDGQTGVNGVYVQLFTPGTDAVSGTLDDVLVSSTLTQNDVSGNPGWYQFPGLAPGNGYRVCFDVPAGFTLTTLDAGPDATDSDANPSTACAPPVNLAPSESNQTIDAGLVRPLLADAGLGNYTYFDADTDGIQNGPLDLGLNGVQVRLFADNGNNIPEPNGADGAPIALTVTDNDVYGIPGYYRFIGLTPGVPYYVQFVLPSAALNFTTRNAGSDDTVDSDADTTSGVSQIVTLAPAEFNPTLDAGFVQAVGVLSLGNQVWFDPDNDGVFEPENGETGIDNVRMDLYRDANADGAASHDEYLGTTRTETRSGFAGIYTFTGLAPGNYIVVIPIENFSGSGPLAGMTTVTGNDPTPDPDNDVNGDDNGADVFGLIASAPVTLTAAGEPTADDGDNNSNMTVDFGFRLAPFATLFDFGDDPDTALNTSSNNYQTVALDQGAAHRISAGGPFLGDCVDADDGQAQGLLADLDDLNNSGSRFGVCTNNDDEDGVTLPASLVPGQNAAIQVRVNAVAACTVVGWIDFNRNGAFEVGEQIVNQNAGAGSTLNLNPLVPANAVPGVSYARFRCGTVVSANPLGIDTTGEVEDYRVQILGQDLGDNPSTYGTAVADNGARHGVLPGDPLRLGACVDTETDGAPVSSALGDDNAQGQQGGGLCFDDEDGVQLPTLVRACDINAYTVTANRAGRLDAFIDFNGNGNYTDLGEKIADNIALASGSNNLTFTAPCGAVADTTQARFRFSTAGALGFNGAATDGEVEDYLLGIAGTDFGDAPAPFPTLFASNGAFHSVNPGVPMFLGSCVDTEGEGVPSAGADGDDLANSANDVGVCTGNDDEDGIALPANLNACATQTATVTANIAGVLDAWIDFNRDGDWSDTGERVANAQALAAGANNLSINTPCNAAPGTTNVRLRFSSTGVADVTGAAIDGEIEDHQVAIFGMDLGDAPSSYGTDLANSGARHLVNPAGNLLLGTCVDTEFDGQPSAAADGDDQNAGQSVAGTCSGGSDDENGISSVSGTTLTPALVAGDVGTITVTATNTAGSDANLCGYIDFDGNGVFTGAAEFATAVVPNGTNGGNVPLSFNVPVLAAQQTYARFRLSTAACAPTGLAADGEVEDYQVRIDYFDLGDLPDSASGVGPSNYETLRANGGARHRIIAGLQLGASVDQEGDGQPNAAANGDDTAGPLADDEDGVTLQSLGYELGSLARVNVNATNGEATAATVCGFIDWNADGDFADTNESASVSVPTGTTATNFVLNFGLAPLDAAASTYGRFRISTDAGCAATGEASNGEVEDYVVITTTNGALSLGDLVFEDLNNNGLVDSGEPGISNVAVSLYQDEDQNCAPDGAAINSTNTDASGNYLFIDLVPGFYIVGLSTPTEYLPSTGTGRVWSATGPFEPAPDPDNNTNSDDNGTAVGTEIRSCAVELRAKDEPTDDGDADFNSNLSVDFGLVRNFDLALIKRRAPTQSNIVTFGQNVEFELTVYNQGSITASNIVLIDYLPFGLGLNDPDWTSTGAQTASITIPGPLAPGDSIVVPITLQVQPNAVRGAPLRNFGEIVEAQDPGGNIRPDKDSTPDNSDGNDGDPIDDTTDNSDGDEDDQDYAEVLVPNDIPSLNFAGLLTLAMLMFGMALRARRPAMVVTRRR